MGRAYKYYELQTRCVFLVSALPRVGHIKLSCTRLQTDVTYGAMEYLKKQMHSNGNSCCLWQLQPINVLYLLVDQLDPVDLEDPEKRRKVGVVRNKSFFPSRLGSASAKQHSNTCNDWGFHKLH